MAIQHPSQIKTALSHLRESAYGTPRAAGDTYRRLIGQTYSVFDDTVAKGNNQGHETGSDLPTDYWSTTAEASFSTDPEFNFIDIGYQLDMALGGYAVGSVTGGLYGHTYTPQDMSVSRQLPSRTFMKYFGSLGLDLATSMVSTAFSISCGKTGRIKTSQTFMGNGKIQTNPASYTMPALTSDREFGYCQQAAGMSLSVAGVGTRQVTTATAVGSASSSANATVTITASGLTGSPLAVTVALTSGDTASQVADKIRIALRANSVVRSFAEVTGATTAIILTKWAKEANDATFNIAIGAGTTGITAAPTSTATTAGVTGTYEAFSCQLEDWTLSINSPAQDDGYRICSDNLVSGDPRTGQLRAEYLTGVREFTFTATARDSGSSNLRSWLQSDTDVELSIPIIGTETNDFSLRLLHTRGRVTQATRVPDVAGFIGKRVTVSLLAASAGDGSIPFTAVLTNNWPSYIS